MFTTPSKASNGTKTVARVTVSANFGQDNPLLMPLNSAMPPPPPISELPGRLNSRPKAG